MKNSLRIFTFAFGLFLALPVVAEEVPIQAYEEGTAPKPADYRSPGNPPPPGQEIRKYAIDAPGKPQKNFGVLFTNDNEPFFQTLGDRLEYRKEGGTEVILWDIDSWYGTDNDKLYLESEGEWNTVTDSTESFQIEAFWNHTIASFWDSQLGVRHDLAPSKSRTFLAAGVQGMAPYVFEVDITFYLSEEADPSAIFEFERDFLLTQRLIFQPRFETQVAFSDASEYEIGSGFTDIEYGLRLRYEFWRKFAPYIGVSWEQSIGQTQDILQEKGKDTSKSLLVAGVKFWF